MSAPLVRTSKFLSYVLRHEPDALGLTLDPGGWADVDTLLQNAQAAGRPLDRPRLRAVLAHGDKRRFALSEDGTKIRAQYGHSIDVDLDLTPASSPPEALYHGTAQKTLPTIRAEGLRPQSRQHVHLSSTQEAAARVGRRHGTPVVLTVDAQGLEASGRALYRATEDVWLTGHVPPRFLRGPDA
jgi:putative RNA 2'-phosphotransferase